MAVFLCEKNRIVYLIVFILIIISVEYIIEVTC